jgi:hypothetical protein
VCWVSRLDRLAGAPMVEDRPISEQEVLLDPSIDTAAAYSDGSVSGSIAKAGSFKGSALIVPAGVDAGLISVALRGRGIFVEGSITVPAAAQALETEGA